MSTRHVIFGAGLALASVAAQAHHSIAAVYDSARQQRLEGVVAEFQFVNPHPFVIVTVQADGAEATWRLEMDNRFELAGVGMSEATLKPGDRVVASGSRARDGSRSLYLLRLDRRADGFWYEQVGMSPRIGRTR